MIRIVVLAGCFLFSSWLPAWGEEQVAVIGAGSWPRSLASKAGFDAASRGAILAFAAALARQSPEPALNQETVGRWREQTLKILTENFRAAAQECRGGVFCDETVADRRSLFSAALRAEDGLSPDWQPWYREISAFFDQYAAEQLRLAARFPETSSEVLTFSEQEVTGFTRPDRHFLLTFDDGPSPRGGSTERTVAILRENNLGGVFFLLGEHLAARLERDSPEESAALYRGMTLGVHGLDHRSPALYSGWLESVRATQALVDSLGGGSAPTRLFRPPYGQRPPAASALLAGEGYRLVLWNIDSADWQQTLAPRQIVGRTQLLMALWRRGIILFHDRYPLVAEALGPLLATMRPCGVVFDSQL